MADLTEPFVSGVIAGYGVAVPLGAIGVLIVDVGMRHGFRPAAAAASGVAGADFAYAGVAAVAGAVVAEALEPYERTVQLVAAAVLVAVAALGLWGLRRRQAAAEPGPAPSRVGLFVRFLALTSVNPATVAYFAALIAGLPAVASAPADAKVAFVIGAGLASLSWQLVLAAAGATLHHRLPASARTATVLAGNALVLGLAVRMALGA